jgi:hypothetical protein
MPTIEAVKCRCGQTMWNDPEFYPKILTCRHCDHECEHLTKSSASGKTNRCKDCERQLDKSVG